MPNRLAHESSPYLLQHQNNPVDWYPWGPEALARSKAEGKPIFLSIGYSACHWCHVMEHESFESPAIAARMNALYVCVKVDREERPDLDQIYMNAVQVMTGRGGWPMSVFLTPDLQPFYGGTYWPPTSRMGMPGFDRVLEAVAEAWRDRRDAVLEQAGQLTAALQSIGREEGSAEGLRPELLQAAEARLERAFDYTHGGFGQAPKFPHSLDLQLLLRTWSRRKRPATLSMVTLTLDKMAGGGIYDHLGGGFARYSVDERWLVPHFEKMLYDNALLTNAYLEAYQATSEERFARIARETCDYVLRDMLDERGGFHSTEDADSEGEEGKFYVWTPAEIAAVLGAERAERFCYVYDVTPHGNFEHGTSILNLPKTIAQCANLKGWDRDELERELAESRAALFAVRNTRVRPGKDDKILVSWNALMIDALARAGAILNEPRFTAAAVAATEFIHHEMTQPDGVKLFHAYRHGVAKIDAFLDDYTYFINALVTVYETTFEERYLRVATWLAEFTLAHFHDAAAGGFFFTADDHEQLIARNKDFHDGSVPSGNGMAAMALARLGKLTGREDFVTAARGALAAAMPVIEKQSMAAGQLLLAADFLLGPTAELVIAGDDAATRDLMQDFHRGFLPNRVLARLPAHVDADSPLAALLAGKAAGAEPRVYLCENFACQAPAEGAAAVRELWSRLHSKPGE